MNARAAKFLDGRLDIVAISARQVFRVRMAMGCGAAVLTGYIYSPGLAAAWFAAFAGFEAISRIVTEPVGRRAPMSRRQHIWQVWSMMGSSLTWTTLAVLYWSEGPEAFRLAAMAVLAGLMVHAQGFSFRSPASLAAFGTAPALCWFILPTLFGGYSGAPLVTLSIALAMLLTYVAASARANIRSAAKLEAAQRSAEAANDAKSAFLAMMSHELRTPLNGVLGMARALGQSQMTSRQQGQVNTILRSGDDLMAILNDILDLSKIEAGRMDLEVAPFDLRALGGQAIELWAEQAAAKGVALTCDVAPGLPVHLLGDEARVRQIVLNLVSNALKFTPSGTVRLVIEAETSAAGGFGGGVSIRVTDSGIGMTAEQLAALFRPYAQAEASTARVFGGTGLGLSICRTLAERMGGEIGAESAPGQGSTFHVRLPLPAAAAPRPASPATQATQNLSTVRILVTDDNPINLAVARAVLEAVGAKVETAGDGAEALGRLRIEAFDLVLMDVNMPRMDGIQAVRHIRAGEAGRPDLPVIALTADAMAGEADRLLTLGFDAVQPKPLEPAALIAAITMLLAPRSPAHRSEAAA